MRIRKIRDSYRSAVYRWLPAVTLSLALPASIYAQPGLTASHFAGGNFDGTSAPGNIATNAPAQITPEEMGDRLSHSGHYQAAAEAYAQDQHPSASVWNKMGIAYQMLYDLKDAARCYKEALKTLPGNPWLLNNLGTVEELLKNYSDAERDYRKAHDLAPNDAIILKNLGTALIMQGENDKGAEAYKQALAINPHIFEDQRGPAVIDPSSAQKLGAESYIKAQICAQAGLTDCALSHLREAFDEGAATAKKVADDADFASLRGTPAMARLLAQQQ